MTDSDKIQTLPLPFLERMKEMLGDDYDAFLKSYKNPRTYGLRVNTAKLSCQDFQALSPFPIRPIPWINTGYILRGGKPPCTMSLLPGGSLLSPGTKCHDTGFQASHRTWRFCPGPLRSSGGKATARVQP